MDKVVIYSGSSGAIYTSVAKICTIESISASMHLTYANVSRYCEHDITASASITWNHWLLAHRLPGCWPARPLLTFWVWWLRGVGVPPALSVSGRGGLSLCLATGGRRTPCSFIIQHIVFRLQRVNMKLRELNIVNTSPFLVSLFILCSIFQIQKMDVWLTLSQL